MIIIIRIFVVFVDDTSSSLQTFKEILAFFGKWFASILLEPFQGIFLKMMFFSFFFLGQQQLQNLSPALAIFDIEGDKDWVE